MLDLWAREHYKSTIITFALTIQEILRNPEITIAIFSHTRPIAKGFLRQIKQEFELNHTLKTLFDDALYSEPGRQATKWSEDDGIIVKRNGNPKESTLEAWGVVDGQPTGKHYKLLIYDDIVTKESVTSSDMIHKTTESLVLSYNLGAQGGRRRFIGTRYHYNDSYREIMSRGTATARIHTATDDGSPGGSGVFMPDRLLAEKRRDMGPYVFSCQMLQSPVADSQQNFRREWLQYYDGQPPDGCNWYIVVDAANGKRKTNDYTSGWAVGLAADKHMYCIPFMRDRLRLDERAARLFAAHRQYQPKQVRYEIYGLQGDVAHILGKQREDNYRFEIIEVSGPTSKEDRIRRLQPLFFDGTILLPRRWVVTNYEGVAVDLIQAFIEEEYMAFPVCVHDDMLDALARICEVEGRRASDSGTVMEKKQIELIWPKIRQVDNATHDEVGDWRTI
jgi:phage terminase large subunit-like protein